VVKLPDFACDPQKGCRVLTVKVLVFIHSFTFSLLLTEMNNTPKKPAVALLGVAGVFLLLFVIAFYGRGFLLSVSGQTKITGSLFFLSRILFWVVLVLLYLYARRIEKSPFLLWSERPARPLFNFGASFAILSIILIGSLIIGGIVHGVTHQETSAKLLEYIALFKNNIPLLIFTALTAGVTEELIFRGYIQPRIEAASNNPALAIIITSLLFGFLHSPYGTINQILTPIYIGAIFSVFYRKYRNIKLLIICHFLFDLVSLLLQVMFQAKR
jgi:membrane protease YdiL (CAAX protease family)